MAAHATAENQHQVSGLQRQRRHGSVLAVQYPCIHMRVILLASFRAGTEAEGEYANNRNKENKKLRNLPFP
jgi:hypothetical protein